jgi:hypothetical protein
MMNFSRGAVLGRGLAMRFYAKLFRWISGVVCGASIGGLPISAWSAGDNSICIAASAFLAQNQIPIQDGMVVMAGMNSPRANWSAAPIGTRFTLPNEFTAAYLAYFLNRPNAPAGAISARISLEVATAVEKTNYVDVYRRAIDRGSDRCEPRGRATVDRRVRVNEYIDYHDPNAGTLSSTLEDFHFKYPLDETNCARTNDSSNIKSFELEDVTRTQGDTLVARNLSFTGTAFAINHHFSTLRSELHYRANGSMTCVGLFVPLGRSPQASVVINEQGFGNFPASKTWLISH